MSEDDNSPAQEDGKRRVMRFKKVDLPRELIVFDTADKKNYNSERWHEGKDPATPPHPSKFLFAAPTSSGKTGVIFNFLLRNKYKQIFLCHGGYPMTREYKDIDLFYESDKLPPLDIIDMDTKKCIILEDLAYENMKKAEKNDLFFLFSHIASHRNCSIYVSHQLFNSIPAFMRRQCDIYTIWKFPDSNIFRDLARKFGYTTLEWNNIFKLCESRFDSITFDTTANTPYPLRKNVFQIIKEK